MGTPRFVVFEGLDGAGKTTQVHLLTQALRQRGIPTEVTQEPTNGPFGAVLRQIIEGRLTVDPTTLAKGFAADRSDHLRNDRNGIEKALAAGAWVVCDRYLLSSLAYQHGQGVSFEEVLKLNEDIRIPDLTLYFAADPKTCAQRLGRQSRHPELFHQLDALATVADNYQKAIEMTEVRFPTVIIPADDGPEIVHRRVLDALAPMLSKCAE
jgi:dTMP kinase